MLVLIEDIYSHYVEMETSIEAGIDVTYIIQVINILSVWSTSLNVEPFLSKAEFAWIMEKDREK